MIFPWVLLFALSAADEPAGPLLSREAHRFPFESYSAWLEFMARAPDPDQRPPKISEQIPKSQFDACMHSSSVIRERLTYRSEGLRLRAILVRPKASGPAPLVMFLHGGVSKWGKITTLDVLEFCALAKQGFAVLAPTLRGEGGSEGRSNLGAGEVADVLNALRVADGLPEIDATRAALWGFSRGGGTAYRVLAKTDRFHLALILAGSTDMVNDPRREEFHKYVYPGVVDGYDKDRDAALKRISPIFWPEKIAKKAHLVLIHGTADRRVPVQDSKRMAQALKQAGRSVKLFLIQGGNHSLRANWSTVRTHMQNALRTHLQSADAKTK